MCLLDSNKVAGDVPAAAQQIHNILQRNHVEVLASRPWDERRLAYPIKGQKKGLYYLIYFQTEGKNLATIEHDFSLNETILRSMIIRIDPKIQEAMLAVARDEHALALQMAGSEGEDGAEGGGERGGERGEDRRRRAAAPAEVAEKA
jgi:small subunit ribosomal protein S6